MSYVPYVPQYPTYMQQMQPQFQPQPQMNYQDRIQQLQTQYNQQQGYPIQQQPNVLQGKVVDSIEVVKATDVPMDGSCYYFPKADGTEVYAKRWLPNGTTEIVSYVPVVEEKKERVVEQPGNSVKELKEEIVSMLASIDGRIDNLEKSLSAKNTTKPSNGKKEG